MLKCRLAGRRNGTAVQQYGKGGGDLAKGSAIARCANDANLGRKVRTGNAQVAPGDGADDEFVAKHVKADRGRCPVSDFDTDGRRSRVVSLLGVGGHIHAGSRGVRTTVNRNWNTRGEI